MIVPLSERIDGVDLLVWSIPSHLVYSWGVLALVFRHSSYRKRLAAKRVGQESLQGFHLAPSLFLSCLDDPCLKPTHVVIGRLPVDIMPIGHSVERRTSSYLFFRELLCCRCLYRHLLSFLGRLVKYSRHERPCGSLPAFA